MHNLEDIKAYYPNHLWAYGENILREYLQHKTLEIIFNLNIADKLCFIGGTALRIVHKAERFSLDLDFDNFNLEKQEFRKVGEEIKKYFELEGSKIEIDTNFQRGVFHYNIKFLNILYENDLTSHRNEKLLIKLDTQPHGFLYKADKFLLKKFDILTYINTAPKDILLSQKIYTIFNRKRKLGRDFYDVVYLSSLTKPSYDYLNFKLGINKPDLLKKKLLELCKNINFKSLVKDVEPVLLNSRGLNMITLFQDFVNQEEF